MAIGTGASAYFIDQLSNTEVQKVIAKTQDDEKKRYGVNGNDSQDAANRG